VKLLDVSSEGGAHRAIAGASRIMHKTIPGK